MDLIIKNASIDEVTAICYRIGEPNFQIQAENERKYGAVETLVNQGMDLTEAEAVYDSTQEAPVVNSVVEPTPINQEQPELTGQTSMFETNQTTQEDLHLESPPSKPEVPVANLKESLQQLATQLAQEKGSEALRGILNSFGAKSLPELNQSHYEAAITKIKELL